MIDTTKKIIKNKSVYFIGLIVLLMTGIILLILHGKFALFIQLNSYHPFWLNVFFVNFTFMGDGIFAICIVAVCFLYFKKQKEGLALLYAFLLSELTVQIIKNLVNSPRPKLFFEQGQYMFFGDGVSAPNNFSFPSGHTATAFAIATVLILFIKNKKWQVPVLLAAALLGFSRIYLAQHYLTDIIAGASIGICSAFTGYSFATQRNRIDRYFKAKIRYKNRENIVYG